MRVCRSIQSSIGSLYSMRTTVDCRRLPSMAHGYLNCLSAYTAFAGLTDAAATGTSMATTGSSGRGSSSILVEAKSKV